MERIFLFTAGGCFVGTMVSLFLNQYNPSPFLLFLLPMWGMVLGVSIARVVNLYKEPEEVKITRPRERFKKSK